MEQALHPKMEPHLRRPDPAVHLGLPWWLFIAFIRRSSHMAEVCVA